MNSATQVLDLSDRENVENYNQIINVKLEQFPVLFRRSICIHSSLQFVDLLMQNLMFSHGFTSTPVIPNQNNGVTNAPKTMIPFYKIRKEFREIFRSRHRNTLSEIAMFVGPCPVRSTYSYRVPIFVCEAEDSTHDSCGDTCGELSDVERRKINRDLFMHSLKDQNDKKMSNKNHRLFVFLKGSEDMVNEEIEEEDPPFDCKSCHEYSFVHEKCNCEGVRAMRTDGKWLRMLPFIVHSKH